MIKISCLVYHYEPSGLGTIVINDFEFTCEIWSGIPAIYLAADSSVDFIKKFYNGEMIKKKKKLVVL